MEVEYNEEQVRNDAGDARSEDSEGHPTNTTHNAVDKTCSTFFREVVGGNQAEYHSDPIGSFELQQRFFHEQS